MLRLGLKASSEQFAPKDLVDLGVMAEDFGLDSVTVSDHFQPWRHKGGHAPASASRHACSARKTIFDGRKP